MMNYQRPGISSCESHTYVETERLRQIEDQRLSTYVRSSLAKQKVGQATSEHSGYIGINTSLLNHIPVFP